MQPLHVRFGSIGVTTKMIYLKSQKIIITVKNRQTWRWKLVLDELLRIRERRSGREQRFLSVVHLPTEGHST
jgi:hypothetical protein